MISIIDSETHTFSSLDGLKDHLKKEGRAEFVNSNFHDVSVNKEGVRIGKKQYGLKESGLSSLLGRIRMPVDYAYRIPDDMFIDDVNRLIKENHNGEITANIQGGNVRAIHSGKYLPITNAEIIDSFQFKDFNPKVKRIHISDEYMSLALTNPNKRVKVKVGDEIEFGFELNNSETGFKRFSLNEYIYRLICTNGAVAEDTQSSVSKIHLGGSDNFDLKEYLICAQNFLENGAKVYAKAFEKMKDSKYTDRELERLGTDIRFSLGKKDAVDLVDRWLDKDLSVYDVYNDVTEIAHTTERLTFEKRQKLEKVGGKILATYRVEE